MDIYGTVTTVQVLTFRYRILPYLCKFLFVTCTLEVQHSYILKIEQHFWQLSHALYAKWVSKKQYLHAYRCETCIDFYMEFYMEFIWGLYGVLYGVSYGVSYVVYGNIPNIA